MNIEERIEEMKELQQLLLDFLDKEEESEANYQNLLKLLSNHNYNDNRQELKLFLNLLENVSLNHRRTSTFYDKIFQIIDNLKDHIKSNFTNLEIFNIFQNDKRIILFLKKQNLLTIDDSISKIIHKGQFKIHHYPDYLTKNNDEICENDNTICNLIRKDSIDEFIVYIHQTNLSISEYTIPTSIYETNPFLLDKKVTLIEYSAFYGSIRVFRYLLQNKVTLPTTIWLYGIHSNNAEIIQLIEENNVECPKKESLIESIKCHHNDIANYIQENLINDDDSKKFELKAIQYYNYNFYPSNIVDNDINIFYYACKYNHYYIAEHILQTNQSFVNSQITVESENNNNNIEEENENENNIDNDGDENENQNPLFKDWASWNRISKKSRDIERIETRNEWKNKISNRDVFPIHIAIENYDIDLLKLLLNTPDISVNQNIINYYNLKNERFYRDLLDTKKEEKTGLVIAIEKGYSDIVKLLLEESSIDINKKTLDCYPSCDITRERKTPLHIAIENDNEEIVLLLSKRPDIYINEKTTFERWWNGGKEEYEEKTPLALAVERNNYEICRILLNNSSKKIDINSKLIEFYTTANLSYNYKRKETPLHIAIKNKNYDIVSLLLSNPTLDIKSFSTKDYRYYQYERRKQLKTPLFLAIENNDFNMVKLLLTCKKINLKIGLLNIGGGSNLRSQESCGRYNPVIRKDLLKITYIKNRQSKLKYLNYRKDNCTNQGQFSQMKKRMNDQKYLRMTEEEDIDDDFDFNYRIFKRISPIEASDLIHNDEIKEILNEAIKEHDKNAANEEEENFGIDFRVKYKKDFNDIRPEMLDSDDYDDYSDDDM